MALAAHRWTAAPGAPAPAASAARTALPVGSPPVFEALHPRAIARPAVPVP
jgi:hypothetical protein